MKIILPITLLILFSYEAFAEIAVVPVHSIEDIPDQPPATGHYRLHLIDVGTGLSILIQGHDWSLLFDAGSADDKSGNPMSGDSNSRIVAYLYKAIGPSGRRSCRPADDDWEIPDSEAQLVIDHMFLSHPHEDHGVMLDDVLECYAVSNIWDSGAINRFFRTISKLCVLRQDGSASTGSPNHIGSMQVNLGLTAQIG